MSSDVCYKVVRVLPNGHRVSVLAGGKGRAHYYIPRNGREAKFSQAAKEMQELGQHLLVFDDLAEAEDFAKHHCGGKNLFWQTTPERQPTHVEIWKCACTGPVDVKCMTYIKRISPLFSVLRSLIAGSGLSYNPNAIYYPYSTPHFPAGSRSYKQVRLMERLATLTQRGTIEWYNQTK